MNILIFCAILTSALNTIVDANEQSNNATEKVNFFNKEKSNYPCSIFDTVDISNGTLHEDGSITHDGIKYATEHYEYYNFIYNDVYTKVSVAKHVRGCICFYKTCIRSCCDDDDDGDDDDICKGNSSVSNDNGKNYAIVYGKPCENGYLVPAGDEQIKLYYDEVC